MLNRRRMLALAPLAMGGLLAFQPAAEAQIIVDIAPPPPRAVRPPPPPRRGYVWEPGHWGWSANGRRHVWVEGRWIAERRGQRYVEPAWVADGPRWRYVPGHWQAY